MLPRWQDRVTTIPAEPRSRRYDERLNRFPLYTEVGPCAIVSICSRRGDDRTADYCLPIWLLRTTWNQTHTTREKWDLSISGKKSTMAESEKSASLDRF